MRRPENKPQNNAVNMLQIRAVGIVCSPLKKPGTLATTVKEKKRVAASKKIEPRNIISELLIDNRLTGILDGIEDFSHLQVIYWAHLIPPEGRLLLKVHPMGKKVIPLKGIFATCSPTRPNTICTTIVRLIKRRDNTLTVEGLDALDGSPIIDIKPYIPSNYPVEEIRIPSWLNIK